MTGHSQTAGSPSSTGTAMGGGAYSFVVTHTETANAGPCANGANYAGINLNGCVAKALIELLTPMAFPFGGVDCSMSVGFYP